MGKAIISAAESAGLDVVPVSFGSAQESGQTVQVGTKEILVHGPSERESILESLLVKYPNLIVVDFTVPSAVNGSDHSLHYIKSLNSNSIFLFFSFAYFCCCCGKC